GSADRHRHRTAPHPARGRDRCGRARPTGSASAMSAHTLPLSRPVPARGRALVLAILAAGWSVAVIDERLLGHPLPGPTSLAKVLPYSLPALLAGLLL